MSLFDTSGSVHRASDIIWQQRNWLKNAILPSMVATLSGTSNANQIFQFVDNLRAALQVMASAVGSVNTAALVTYVQGDINSPTYDALADYNALVSQLNAIINWVVTNFPKDTSNFIEIYSLNADGSRTPATFTSAQTTQLVTLINSAITQLN